MLVQGQEKGEISPDIDAMAAAMMFLGMVQPLAIMSQINKEILEDYPQKLWQNYQRSIAPINKAAILVDSRIFLGQ